MTVGERLFNLRKEKNLSQEELANALDVSRQTISKWETDQSTPDFDKIIPLCNYFGITSDELLTGNSNIIESKKEDNKKTFARNIAISVCMYILAVVAMLIFAFFNKPEIGVVAFFVIVALATGLVVYNGITYSNSNEEKKVETKEEKEERLVKEIVGAIGAAIYFIVSFATFAWHLTWIIFIIVGVVDAIVSLIYSIKEDNKGDVNNE